jgi:hypothetical protein
VRLPPIVHGEGDKAFMPALIALAKEKAFQLILMKVKTNGVPSTVWMLPDYFVMF